MKLTLRMPTVQNKPSGEHNAMAPAGVKKLTLRMPTVQTTPSGKQNTTAPAGVKKLTLRMPTVQKLTLRMPTVQNKPSGKHNKMAPAGVKKITLRMPATANLGAMFLENRQQTAGTTSTDSEDDTPEEESELILSCFTREKGESVHNWMERVDQALAIEKERIDRKRAIEKEKEERDKLADSILVEKMFEWYQRDSVTSAMKAVVTPAEYEEMEQSCMGVKSARLRIEREDWIAVELMEVQERLERKHARKHARRQRREEARVKAHEGEEDEETKRWRLFAKKGYTLEGTSTE